MTSIPTSAAALGVAAHWTAGWMASPTSPGRYCGYLRDPAGTVAARCAHAHTRPDLALACATKKLPAPTPKDIP